MNNDCNINDFDFDVTNVQVSFQTVMGDRETGSVGLQVPLFGTEGSLDASRQASQTTTIALTRRFRYDKDQLRRYEESDDYRFLEEGHKQYQYYARNAPDTAPANPVLPIADTLIKLRKSISDSAKLPCFDWADKDVKPESSSITLEFLVQRAANSTVGFNFWVVSAKADAKIERKNVNTLVVSFAPHRAVPAPLPPAQQIGQASGTPEVKPPT
jgi:hypothetical protein